MRRHLTRLAVATIAILAIATDPPAAHAATSVDRAMGNIAAHQQMGFKDNRTPYTVLEHRINTGGRVYASCSIVAELGYRWAARHGIPARHVSAITNARFDGYNDGHAMLELKLDGRWVLYDLDLNRKAVDETGHGVGLAYQLRAGMSRRWKVIAHDGDAWDWRGTTTAARRALAPKAGMAIADWYERAFGVALVEMSPGQYAYHGDGRHSARIDAVWPGHYQWVGGSEWRALNR